MLTISVLNYNGKEFLGKCLEAILKQKWLPEDYELMLVDNASTDGSGPWAFNHYPIHSLIQASNEHQFITGLNETFKYAKWDKVLFITNDVILEPDAIGLLCTDFDILSEVIIQPVFMKDEKIQNAGMNLKWPGYGLAQTRLESFISPFETEIFATGCFMMKKSTYKRIGEFDIKFAPACYEDVDYSLRAKKLGIRRFVSPLATCEHLTSQSFTPRYGKRKISQMCYKNRQTLVKKHFKGLDKWLRLIAIHAGQFAHNLITFLHNIAKKDCA